MVRETTDLQPALLIAVKSIRDFRLFKRETTFAKLGKTTRVFGTAGQSDLWGIWRGGIHVEIELKSARGVLSPKQLLWQETCVNFGVPHLVLQALPQESLEETIRRWVIEIETTKPDLSILQRVVDYHNSTRKKSEPIFTYTHRFKP